MLMRHARLGPSATPAVLTLPVAVVQRPVLALLMASARLAHAVSACRCRARWRAVAVAPVAATTEQELPAAPRAAPPNKLLHASAIASAVDSASRPCEAMRVGSACLKQVDPQRPGAQSPGCPLPGRRRLCPYASTVQLSKKPTRRIPRSPALAMRAIPRFSMRVYRYVFLGRVRDADGRPIALLQRSRTLARGLDEVPLTIDGGLLIDQHPRLPISLFNVEGMLLFPDTFPDRAPLRPWAGPYALRLSEHDDLSREVWQTARSKAAPSQLDGEPKQPSPSEILRALQRRQENESRPPGVTP